MKNKKLLLNLLIFCVILLSSCADSDSGDSATATAADTANYTLTFTSVWSESTHPYAYTTTNPHFSKMIGAVHHSSVNLWKTGHNATAGIQSMAETGKVAILTAEVEDLITAGTAYATITSATTLASTPGSLRVSFTVTQSFPVVSVTTMIAPSPDWFVGVSNLSLFQDGAWVQSLTIDLYPYDAGTDDGADFTSANSPVSTPLAIERITTGPFYADDVAMGTFTFTKTD